MRKACFVFIYLLSVQLNAQIRVTFQLLDVKETEPLFLASNLSKWSPNDTTFRFKTDYSLSIIVKPDTEIQYKITRGSWDKVESQANGYPIENRTLIVKKDTTITLTIAGWQDKTEKVRFSSDRLLVDTLYSQHLQNQKAIWMWLPKNYKKDRKYPVVYMQDGQNLFDGYYTHNGQEWRVDETLDSLNDLNKGQFIVVGIGSDKDRLSEYSPYPWKEPREIKGAEYIQFLVKELIPYIDSTFKTNGNRSIAGSSMGALISLKAILDYPDLFQSVGIFSIAQASILPDNETILEDINRTLSDKKQRSIFLYAGGKETDSLPVFTRQIFDIFEKHGTIRATEMYNKEGRHEEKYWSKPFVWYIDFLDK